jgi:ABC-type transport system involved in multi-copper enzyme maturation permease subunit
VIQISMSLALFVMAVCLFMYPQLAAWYIAYVVLFNMLVGPVFLASSVTSERERSTLDMLLTTLITPWQMLWGKLLSGLRVSTVLTSFLLWPVVLAVIMPLDYWSNLPTMGGFFLIVGLTCVTTSMTALFCSALFRRSATSLMCTYAVIAALFLAPVAAGVFVQTFARGTTAEQAVEWAQITSPFAAAFNLPLVVPKHANLAAINVWVFWGYVGFSLVYNLLLLGGVMQLFKLRWRVSE